MARQLQGLPVLELTVEVTAAKVLGQVGQAAAAETAAAGVEGGAVMHKVSAEADKAAQAAAQRQVARAKRSTRHTYSPQAHSCP